VVFVSRSRFVYFCAVAGLLVARCGAQKAVQVDVSTILNDRVVFTVEDGKLDPALHAVDHGRKSVLITKGAAALADSGTLMSLPDSDLIAANERHPDVKLHYAQAGSQVRKITASTESFAFDVPGAKYSQLQMFFISAQGESPISVKLSYADGSSDERETTVPDFYFPKPKVDDPRWFILVDNFGKVDMDGKKVEADHHYIHGVDLSPDPAKTLVKVEVTKTTSTSQLTFFGATGQTVAASGRGHKKKV